MNRSSDPGEKADAVSELKVMSLSSCVLCFLYFIFLNNKQQDFSLAATQSHTSRRWNELTRVSSLLCVSSRDGARLQTAK